MFTHLLLPTDGSDAAQRAAEGALTLAHEHHAHVTALHVIQPFDLFAYAPDMVGVATAQYEQQARDQARALLDAIEARARALGVPCESRITVHAQTHEAVIATAREAGCDLIVMGSHGRRGLAAVLLGSTTQKVLTHCQRPVLVFR